MNKSVMIMAGSISLLALITGCNSSASPQNEGDIQTVEATPTEATVTVVESELEDIEMTETKQPVINIEVPQPDHELVTGEYRWNQLLARDAIYPIYDPQFAPANQASYEDGELVIGVALNGEAKAYAIGPLNNREMVNDTVGGVPILVTW